MKKCTNCGIEKDLSAYSFRSKTEEIRHNQCKECHSSYRRVHYLANKRKYIEKAHRRNIKQRALLKGWLASYLADHKCVDCEVSDVRVLDFDHRDPEKKKHTVSEMIRGGFPLEKVKQEVSKCDIRCSNCHRIRHFEENGWIK
jgi:hypothetical protein